MSIAQGTVEAVDLPFAEAIAFFAQKANVKTKSWTDVWAKAHARAFAVAGAATDALVEDFRQAVFKAISSGTTLDEFRADFDRIVARHGWEHTGTAGWRARIIYETNLSMAYSAGRYAQQTDPDVLAVYPFWQYRHSGNPHPRLQHLAWDGLTLRADDPWWQTHYPPNGWNCGCYTEPVTARGLGRQGKSGPDPAPPLEPQPFLDRKTGEIRTVPKGIDPGFAYNPGEAWRGAVQIPGRAITATPVAPPAPSLPVKSFASASEGDTDLTRAFAGWARRLSPDQRDAIADYKSDFGPQINALLRSGANPGLFRETIQALDTALETARTPRDLVVQRGVKDIDFLAGLKPGDRFTDAGFVSASLQAKTAKKLSAKVPRLVIEIPAGSRAAYVNHVPAVDKMQYELLIRRGSTFEIVSRDERTIVLRLIP